MKPARSLAWIFLLLMCACSLTQAPVGSPSSKQVGGWKEGQIIETTTGKIIPLDELVRRIRQQEVVYFGEEHHNQFHIEAALAVLTPLTDAGRRPIVAMEMFGWESQPILDRYVKEDLGRREFVEQVGWKRNWGGPFEDYEPLVSYAKVHELSLIALNPPKPLIRLVAKDGLVQARLHQEWVRWGMEGETIVDDPMYRRRLVGQLRACHDGGSDAMYESMYEASMVRDEGMAKTIVAALQSSKDSEGGLVVSYTGGGHIQYGLPIPKRVARRRSGQIRQTTIYMTAYEAGRLEEIGDMIDGRIADYVWLTPVSSHGPPRRCR